MSLKQFAPACERNKDPILEILKKILPRTGLVLEIGSGTGQHAAYFAAHLPHLVWQPTDVPDALASISAWVDDAALANLHRPLPLDLFAEHWPIASVDAIVCINAIHIVGWKAVENLFAGAARTLVHGGMMYVYGAYRYANRPLEPSNEAFDQWLKHRDPASGVRNFEDVDALARTHGLTLAGDRAMPANNRSIWWVKK